MSRKYTLFIYNGTQKDQDWSIYSQDVINQTTKIGQTRKTYTLQISGDVTIQFGVADTVYLSASYAYETDSWTSQTNTPNEISFSSTGPSIAVTSSYVPERPR